jgi:hypothetical protein
VNSYTDHHLLSKLRMIGAIPLLHLYATLAWSGIPLPVERDCNVMAHAQRLDFVFQRKRPVHSNRRGCQVHIVVVTW